MNGHRHSWPVSGEAAADFEIRRAFADDLRTIVASRQADLSLSVGERLPDFRLPDVDGTMVAAADLLSIGPVVVTFYRGAWCPFCNADLAALELTAEEIRRSGALLIAISPQSVENNHRAMEEIGLSFPILSDARAELARNFGIRWVPSQAVQGVYRNFGIDVGSFNIDGSWALPMPARYVAAQDGTVLYAHVSPNYTRRPQPTDVLPVLEALRRARV